MTERRVTAALVLALVAVCAWMYLRDRGLPASPRSLPERSLALADATQVLQLLARQADCSGGCGAEVLDHTVAGTWRVRIDTGAWRRCFSVSLNRFAYSAQGGMRGIEAASCR
jgi:hypothetical protein